MVRVRNVTTVGSRDGKGMTVGLVNRHYFLRISIGSVDGYS